MRHIMKIHDLIDMSHELIDPTPGWKAGAGFRKVMPHVCCMDGTTMSVQVGNGLYCTPRDNNGPYTHVEVGYPSKVFKQLYDFMEGSVADGDDPTKCVYGYVPIELVDELLDACGGICIEVTLLKVENSNV